MTFLTWTNLGGYLAVAAAMFFLIVRLYSRRLRTGVLNAETWDSAGVFSFGVMMGVIWPLTILWLAAVRPSRAERKETARRDLASVAVATERKAQALGVGGWDDERGDLR